MKHFIGIEDHKIHCIIGHNPEEWISEQEICVDLKVQYDFSNCAATDHITDTVDYVLFAQMCTDLAKSRRYRLLETFACEIVHKLLDEFSVEWAWIRVKKAAGLATAQYTYVEYERSQRER